MAPKTPTPDGLPAYDPNAVYTSATAATGATTAKTDIWNIPPDLLGKTLITDYGSKINQGTRSRLEGADQDYQTANAAPKATQIALDAQGNPVAGSPYALPLSMYTKDPKQYLALQQALFQAGYFGSKSATSMRWGGDTASTMDAWTALLRETVQQQSLGHNVTWQDVLSKSVANTTAAATAAGKAPHTDLTVFTDPARVAAQAQQAAQAALGRNMTDSELQHFISEYHAAEAKYGQQSNAADIARSDGTGGSFSLTQPDLEGEATAYVQQNNGTEIAGNNMSDYVRALEQMLGG